MRVLTCVVMLGMVAGGALRAQDAERSSVWIEDDTDRREFVIAMGPFDLAAGTRFLDELGPSAGHQHDPHAVHGAAMMPPVTTLTAPKSVYLTGFSYELHDADGQELPPDFVHHLNLVNPDNRELFLPIAQRMLAVGKETGSQSMPGLLMGYPVPEGTSSWAMTTTGGRVAIPRNPAMAAAMSPGAPSGPIHTASRWVGTAQKQRCARRILRSMRSASMPPATVPNDCAKR